MINIISRQGNTNQNLSEITPHPVGSLLSKKWTLTSVGEMGRNWNVHPLLGGGEQI